MSPMVNKFITHLKGQRPDLFRLPMARADIGNKIDGNMMTIRLIGHGLHKDLLLAIQLLSYHQWAEYVELDAILYARQIRY